MEPSGQPSRSTPPPSWPSSYSAAPRPATAAHQAPTQSAERTVRRLKIALSLVAITGVVAVAFLLGTRSEKGAATRPVGTQAAAPTAPEPGPPVQAGVSAASTATAPACVSEVEEVSDSVREIGSRLKVGLNVGEYTELVGDAQVALDSIRAAPGACEEALDHFDAAVLIHNEAATDWELCIEDYPRCYVLTVPVEDQYEGIRLFRLYKSWERAERETRRGDASLRALEP